MSMNQECVSAANVLSGERMVKEISFPITGDLELDCCSGLIAVLHHFENHARAEKLLACLHFVRRRYEELAEHERTKRSEEGRLEKLREALQCGQLLQQPDPTPWQSYPPNSTSCPQTLSNPTIGVVQSVDTSAKVDANLLKSLLSP